MSPLQLRNIEDWVYVQLFLPKQQSSRAAVAMADAILLDSLMPMFSSWDVQGHTWFFIRYHEQGYHLRLRIHSESAALRAQFKEMMANALSTPIADGAQLRFAAYEPEIDKYGGLHGNHLAEQHFCVSSTISLRILADKSTPLAERALRLLTSTLEAAGLDRMQSLTWCRAYYDYWWREVGAPAAYKQEDEAMFQYSRATIECKLSAYKQNSTESSPSHAAWLQDWMYALKHDILALKNLERARFLIDPIKKRDNAQMNYVYPATILSMLPNFWHMLCNRLGISVRQEMRLAYCLMRHLTVQQDIEFPSMTMNLIPDKI